jgi:hypothetical protein
MVTAAGKTHTGTKSNRLHKVALCASFKYSIVVIQADGCRPAPCCKNALVATERQATHRPPLASWLRDHFQDACELAVLHAPAPSGGRQLVNDCCSFHSTSGQDHPESVEAMKRYWACRAGQLASVCAAESLLGSKRRRHESTSCISLMTISGHLHNVRAHGYSQKLGCTMYCALYHVLWHYLTRQNCNLLRRHDLKWEPETVLKRIVASTVAASAL